MVQRIPLSMSIYEIDQEQDNDVSIDYGSESGEAVMVPESSAPSSIT